MRLDPKTEKSLKQKALEILENGRPNWDIPHTLATVYWMRKLLESEEGNERILVTTMYLHDIGYSKAGGKLNDYDSIEKANASHMHDGVEIARPILEELHYTNNEVYEILHLIGMHDKIESLSTNNEILVFEADSLSQIDVDRFTSNFDKENLKRFLKYYEEKRYPKFRTKSGKRYVSELFTKAKRFYGV